MVANCHAYRLCVLPADAAPVVPPSGADLAWYVDDLKRRGIRRVHVLAWRDLDDDDAGGSEVHADELMSRWAEHGLDVLHRTSAAVGLPATDTPQRLRRRAAGEPLLGVPAHDRRRAQPADGPYDALVEIWNGVPWFSPVWCRKPHITVLHHVHGPMWDQILPGPLAAFGRALEARIAPPFYRRGLTVTPSDATREELLELGFRPDRVRAFPNGVDELLLAGRGQDGQSVDARRRPAGAGQALRARDRRRHRGPPAGARPDG